MVHSLCKVEPSREKSMSKSKKSKQANKTKQLVHRGKVLQQQQQQKTTLFKANKPKTQQGSETNTTSQPQPLTIN